MSSYESLQSVLEDQASAKSFSMRKVADQAALTLSGSTTQQKLFSLSDALDGRVKDYVLKGAIRAAFFIELVNEGITSTKFAVRWSDRLPPQDPRYADFEACIEIFEHIIKEALEAARDNEHRETLELFSKWKQLPYELPLDYFERRMSTYIHEKRNVGWLQDDLPSSVIKLRSYLLDHEQNDRADSFRAIYEKIRVKSYLTDRAQTGAYQTNREKRWEAHPESPQFALRRACLGVEFALLNQLCHFEGFNEDLRERLLDKELLAPLSLPVRCPITMDPMSFEEFESEVSDPQHGKASFHVGHLNPLKAVNDDPNVGHTARNIGWTTEDGNRIQGSLSLADTRDLLQRIQDNYGETQSD